MKIFAVMAVHNRVKLTLRCLESLRALDRPADVEVIPVVIDDGSTDGTSEQVAEHFPETILLHGDGSLFWGPAMHLGITEAVKRDADFVWWLNDDMLLDRDCLVRLLEAHEKLGDGAIIVGCVYGPEGEWLYGGYRVTPLFKFRPVHPDAQEQELFDVDSMNGNCVFVPRRILDELPQPDPEVFIQCGADIEYALRARKHGFRVVVAARARALGIPNPNKTYWRQPGVGFLDRWRAFTSRRGWYPPMHWNICAKYGGLLGPLWFLRTYASMAAISLWYLVSDRVRPRRA